MQPSKRKDPDSKLHFAIVSYTFPPSKEIGGRRWAKFSQQLAKKGHAVSVLCANEQVSPQWFEKDFKDVKIIALPKRYPEWLTGITKSWREKILYLLFVRLWSPFTKQNLFDRGFAWRNTMLDALEKLHHKNPIDVLVVTGAPFSLLRYGSEFKKRHNEIFYVGDLRDPWTWGSYYGIPDLSVRKKRYQEESERIAMENSDMVCYPTQHMGEHLLSAYPLHASKLYLLPHAYDPEKFEGIARNGKRQGFIYGGAIYNGIEEYLMTLERIVKARPESGFRWDIYTGTPTKIIDGNFAGGKVKIHPLIPEEQLFQKIASSSAYLAFFPVTDKDLVSTKFFEIIYTGTPILYIGEEGDVGRFISNNRLGVHILPDKMESELPKYLTGNVPFEPGFFDVTRFSFSTVTDNFIKEVVKR